MAAQLTPAAMARVASRGGHRVPSIDRHFRFAYLGCGDAKAAADVARAYPHATVLAWDWRTSDVTPTSEQPLHGLENCHVTRGSLPLDLGGQADFVVLDHVLDAADDELRSAIGDLLARTVRRGGIVAVAYRTTVGWMEVAALVHVMRRLATAHEAEADTVAPRLLAILHQLREEGARFINERPNVTAWIASLMEAPHSEVEGYLADPLRPVSHNDVRELLEPAAMAFVGSVDDVPIDDEALRRLVDQTGDAALRESYRDLAMRRTERVDVFVKASRRVSASTGSRRYEGYIVDVPYIEPTSPELCPAWFSMIAALHGASPIDLNQRLVWAELGVGGGLSACIVAAANPNTEVWGCDINPAHIERARYIAAMSGLDNCAFDLASFEDVAIDDTIGPREVDVVTVHGVWSWISRANQQRLVEFIRHRLKPGGLVYVSYECLTGWAAMVPIAEALRLYVDADGRPSDVASVDAYRALRELQEAGAAYFPLPPAEATFFTDLDTAHANYAAHEYLGAHFAPTMFDEVARSLARADCAYVGSTDVVDAVTKTWGPSNLGHLRSPQVDVTVHELLRDTVIHRALRSELYQRRSPSGGPPATSRSQDFAVIGTGRAFDESIAVQTPFGDATLDPAIYAPLVESLTHGAVTVESIRRTHVDYSEHDACGVLAFLVAGGYALPRRTRLVDQEAVRRCRRLNQLLQDERHRGLYHPHLASTLTGGAVADDELADREDWGS